MTRNLLPLSLNVCHLQYQPLNLSVILPLALPDHLYHIIFVEPYLSISQLSSPWCCSIFPTHRIQICLAKHVEKTVKDWVQNCIACQRSKVHRHTKTPLGTFALPDARFSHIHVDLIGPLPSSEGKSFLLNNCRSIH
ncbi:retrovirus-related Pol polyprotein from transposon 412 [Trichonephila clavipes]|nr:retrovirus-related Pol polyprotein from transposon 412 [Trichonephila clavipes]